MNYFYLVVKMVRLWPMAGVPRSKGRYSRMLGRCSAPCALCSCLKCLAPCALRPCLNGLAPCALVLFYIIHIQGKKKRTMSRGPWSFVVSAPLLRLIYLGSIPCTVCRRCIVRACLLPLMLGTAPRLPCLIRQGPR